VASIPSGWALCNGSNGTPDLRNRFVVGAGSTYAVDGTGGSADAIVVSHTHTATSTSTVTDPGHVHQLGSAGGFAGGGFPTNETQGASGFASSSATTGITVATSTTNASTGSSGTNANLPPYYALAYIIKL
jgi:microcystin-dependent protein